MVKHLTKGKLRVLRARSTGFTLLGIMGFLIAGFVLEPIASSLPDIAPQSEFQIPFTQENQNVDNQLKDNTIPEGIVNTPPKPNEQPQTLPEFIMDDPPVPTITSNDTTIEQIVDETKDTPADVILPNTGSQTINLIAEISKQDSTGKITVVTNSFSVQALSFFAEKGTNIDYQNGFLVIKLSAISSDPNLKVSGTGDFDILIANKTILTSKIPITVNGISGVNGTNFLFASSIGQLSDLYTFSFKTNEAKFPASGSTLLEFKISNLKLKLDDKKDFGSNLLDIFSMTIDTDQNQLIIADQNGVLQRIYPSDDILSISSRVTVTNAYSAYGNYCIFGITSPPMGSVLVLDSADKLISQGDQVTAGSYLTIGGCGTIMSTGDKALIDTKLQRDQIYRVKIQSPTPADFTFTTPKSQKTYSFYCIQGTSSSFTNSYDIGAGTYKAFCNFPKSGEFTG